MADRWFVSRLLKGPMAHLEWKEHYRIGYKDIDAQHRALLDLLNQLIDLMDQGGPQAGISRIFQRLCHYATTHFANEEAYLRAAGYPELPHQQAEHAVFIQQLLTFDQTYNPTDPTLLEETRRFLQDWFLRHILESDLDYVPHMKRFYNQAPIRGILFDFGQVLCRFDNARFLEGLSSFCEKPAATLKEALYRDSTLTQDYEAGRIDSKAFLGGVSDLCGMQLPEADFIRIYTDIFTPIQASFDLIRKLKPAYRIGLISNTSPWHFEHAIRTTEIFPLLDAVTLSFEVGACKPDSRLFEDALQKLGLLAEECVFIDDQAAFAQAATDHLLHGITYTTPVALMAQLRQAKVEF